MANEGDYTTRLLWTMTVNGFGMRATKGRTESVPVVLSRTVDLPVIPSAGQFIRLPQGASDSIEGLSSFPREFTVSSIGFCTARRTIDVLVEPREPYTLHDSDFRYFADGAPGGPPNWMPAEDLNEDVKRADNGRGVSLDMVFKGWKRPSDVGA